MNAFHMIGVWVLFAAAFVAGDLHAQPWYVDAEHASASDSNPGTAQLPLQTLARATELAMPGDTVFIKGLYHESLYLERGGTAGQPIVFAAAPGSEAIIDGGSGDPGNNGVVSTFSWVSFEGLEVRNWNENGMWFEGGENIVIRDCEVHDVTYGIGMTEGTHDFVLERVVMHHFDLYGFDASPSGSAICYNGTFIECVSHTGRDPAQNVDGFALGHGDQYGFVFRNCETYGVYDGFDISSQQTTLEGCSAHDCSNGGYKLWQDEITMVNCLAYHNGTTNVELDWDGVPGSVTMWNCSFHDTETFNVWVENGADSLFMYNCILSGGDNSGLTFEIRGTANYFGDYNLFQNDNAGRMVMVGYEDEYGVDELQAWQSASGQDAHSQALVSIAGVYVDEAQYDLHLTEGSPARDHGVAAGAPATDFEGNPRPDGAAVDIGAYEFQSSTPAAQVPQIPSLGMSAYPNPSKAAVSFRVTSDNSATAVLTVFDVSGRLLFHRTQRLIPGTAVIVWDGTDLMGARHRGSCVAVVNTPAASQSVRLILQ